MDATGMETRRHIKPGDIFRAHLSSTAGDPEAPDIDGVLAASARMRKAGESGALHDAESVSGGILRGHEAVYSGDVKNGPYHWGVSIPRFTLRNIDSPEGNMENLQKDVMDAIHDALSKESLIKKLVIPFNGTRLECKHAVSHWEWQKNTALLELEHRNQQLQHELNEAAKQVLEAHARAEYDRKLLAEALQKGKEELYLIGRAETMRTRLIERTQMIARSQLLCTSFFSWWRYSELCRKKKILEKAEFFWHRKMLGRKFDRFIVGCEKIRKKQLLNLHARHHWLEKCFNHWRRRSRRDQELKKVVLNKVKLHRLSLLTSYFGRWQVYYSRTIGKRLQVRRAQKVHSYNYLQKCWNWWMRKVEISREGIVVSRNFFVHRLLGYCVRGWLNVVYKKNRRKQQMELSIHLEESKALGTTFDIWYMKTSAIHVVKERLAYFVQRKEERFLKVLFTKWQHRMLRTGSLRTIMRLLAMKAKVWYLRWGFSQLKQRWISSKLVERSRDQRVLTTRSAIFQQWSWTVKQRKGAKMILAHVQTNNARRRLQKSFYLWMFCIVDGRKSFAEEEARKLQVQVKVLEIDLRGSARVKREMENLMLELENGRKKLQDSLDAAMGRNPVWTSGFLDVLLRWTVPLLERLPPARAGHTAVSLPKRSGSETCTRVVIFGGYNGEECLNDVFLFETDDMQLQTLVCSAADGCSIPSPRQTHTACAVGADKMILLGGFDGTNDLSDLIILKILGDGLSCEWSQPPSVIGAKPGPISQHTSCLYKEGPSMVVFGGYRSSVGLLNELWILDLHWMLWGSPEYFGTPPSPRRGHGAAIIGTKMFVFGGFNGKENLSDLHALDLESMTWETVETQGAVPSPRRQFAVAVVGQHFVVHGGFSGHKYLGDVFSFHANHKRWSKWPEIETQQSLLEIGETGKAYGRSMHTMVECGQRLVIFGGVHEFGALQDILFIENASAVEGLQLQSSLVEELEKTKNMQRKIIECEDAVREKSMELVKAQECMEDLRTTLQVESDKKKKALQGHQVLSTKLQKARKAVDRLSQKCNGLREANEELRTLNMQHMDPHRQAP